MRPVKHVLLAIKDPAAPPTAAIRKAIQLASAFGASLELFHSITSRVYMDLDMDRQDVEQLKKARLAQNYARLDALAKRSREAGVSTVTSVKWDYPPHEAVM